MPPVTLDDKVRERQRDKGREKIDWATQIMEIFASFLMTEGIGLYGMMHTDNTPKALEWNQRFSQWIFHHQEPAEIWVNSDPSLIIITAFRTLDSKRKNKISQHGEKKCN